MASEFPDIPHNMRKVYRRFERWRSAHTGRLPIPERLWAAAAELAREHGVFPTAKALHLEYGKLKRRVGRRRLRQPFDKLRVALRLLLRAMRDSRIVSAVEPRSRAAPAFVELLAPRPGSSPECRVELEGPRGRMRIEFKGIATAELLVLSRALWDGEA